ncbi:hypothetical protein SUGI_0017620 [Cryptomeria japonica]|uniref:single myb histone 3 n=1 Tax=Cryptomeria japonica TaxID=3369 RepID=UPI002408CC97|nr:single myb histone 3 [Cryptomeria japonica]GLJ05401.1 hypothetical protein SUGI_0017620 [Cryptomeria japonica]
MGAPKQKWTSEEESALRKGVEKYGAGRWRTIQKDPEFGQCLAARSNVDLKDKWRNMSVSASGQGSRERIRIPKKAIAAVPFQSLTPEATPALAIEAAPSTSTDNLVSRKISTNGRTPIPRYEDMIVEALTAMQDPNGNDVITIASYIEQRHEVPQNFRRLLSSKLKRLATQDKIVKILQNYKLKSSIADLKPASFESTNISDSSYQHSNITSEFMDDSINEASMAAAQKMAESEEMTYMAGAAAQEEEFALGVADESDMFFQAASIVFEQFLQDGVVEVR